MYDVIDGRDIESTGCDIRSEQYCVRRSLEAVLRVLIEQGRVQGVHVPIQIFEPLTLLELRMQWIRVDVEQLHERH